VANACWLALAPRTADKLSCDVWQVGSAGPAPGVLTDAELLVYAEVLEETEVLSELEAVADPDAVPVWDEVAVGVSVAVGGWAARAVHPPTTPTVTASRIACVVRAARITGFPSLAR
jgi:hypothetical protein